MQQADEVVLSILNTIKELDHLNDIDMILDRILYEARRLANADAGSIFLAQGESLVFNQVQNDSLYGKDGNRAVQYTNLSVPCTNASIVGHAARSDEIIAIDDAYNLPSHLPCTFNSSFDEEFSYRTVSILAIPLHSFNNQIVGVMQLINAQDKNKRPIPFSKKIQTYLQLFSNNAAVAIERGTMNRELILRMVKMSELHDPKETGAHVQRVGAYSAEIFRRWAQKYGLDTQELKSRHDMIRLAAMLHDVGKVGIADVILKKPGPLDDTEFSHIKQHTILGARLFANTTSNLDKMSLEIALHHHEKWDGSGYPGTVDLTLDNFLSCCAPPLKGDKIPLEARITALADVYDALSSTRVYKEVWDDEDIYAEILANSGKHFDPEIVDIFFEITDVLKAIRNRYQ
ncbi:MAG: HD domain-containing protein [Proteobacteria bacterium]|nr:HD domain-containing protein [Pseudomonadota bacterium]MBU1640601.1 HD domain-containing protein [Pseudomonadota bacterium]